MSSTLQLPCPSFLRGGFLFLSFSFIIESWISYKRSLQIINVRHRHCVFTIDASLRDFFLQDRSLLNCLFHSVSSVVLRLFSKMNKHKNFTPGFIMVLHTFRSFNRWRTAILSSFGYDPLICPHCKQQMVILEIYLFCNYSLHICSITHVCIFVPLS